MNEAQRKANIMKQAKARGQRKIKALQKVKHNKIGRPTRKTPKTINKLKKILKIGGTIEQACAYAKITTSLFYTWGKNDPEFMRDMESAKLYTSIVAKKNIQKAIRGKDLNTSKWWIEKTEFNKESGLNVDSQGGGIEIKILNYKNIKE